MRGTDDALGATQTRWTEARQAWVWVENETLRAVALIARGR